MPNKRGSGVKKKKGEYDRNFFIFVVSLTLLGLVAVADVSAPQALAFFKDKFYFVKQQATWAGIGFLFLILGAALPYTFWKKIAPLIFGLSILLLIAVLIPGLSTKALGARRWLALGPFGFQPAELVKLSTAIFMAWLLDREASSLLTYLIPLGVIGFLIMLQPDFGTTIVTLGIGVIQLFVAGIPLLYFLGIGLIGGLLGAVVVFFSDYRKQRLMTFLKASVDPLGSSYHIRQILLALGSGGFLGVGLGQSRQKYLFLPEVATDSVFAVIAEELGFLGGAILIILLTAFIFKAIKIAREAPDDFSTILATGIVAWIGGQMFLNMGSMVALIPLTGIPLPFFSYGGSSLTMILLGSGILLNISKHGQEKKDGLIKRQTNRRKRK